MKNFSFLDISSQWALLTGAIYLLLSGGGKWSLDHLWINHRRNNEA